ncbi:SMP-30/gluconolactonase/LRE family protein [Pantoea sp. 1.19]|uniref:SMP-30/gluconolactonase/LRE family protein n=1 Tax=Pantoea sp. 1.19 TaxID=1925589 RepID=UPI000AE3160A|nr:SMP-30/gluconolactonase/LRE family protein [Pantoea sp. 1.19]
MSTAITPFLPDYRGELPECPTWDAATQTLWWTDILKKEIHCCDAQGQQHRIITFTEEPGCFALRREGGLIVALRSGIWLCDAQGQLSEKVCDNPSNPALCRFNDGGVDSQGRFYAGTFWAPGDFNGALLCRVDTQLQTRVIQCDIMGHNGLAFSADGRWMYSSDTPNGVIWRAPIGDDGEPGARSAFHRFQPGDGLPDGAAMDVEGGYWSALYDGWRLCRFSPDGEVLESHRLPVRCPTMVCFGGADMRTLFVTTTREHFSAEEIAQTPLAGAIFSLRVGVAGVSKPRFCGV